jgi:argininosuccinate lyase
VAELIRGKTGRIYGNLLSLLTIMKGLPLSYNRDLQEDKISIFDSIDTVKSCLTVLNAMFPQVIFNTERLKKTAGDAFSTATDIADYLARKGVSFRKAHEITGKMVRYCMKKNKRLEHLSVKELKAFSAKITTDIYKHLSADESVRHKISVGGTSPTEVKKQIRRLKKLVNSRL